MPQRPLAAPAAHDRGLRDDDISMSSTQDLRYPQSILDETLRYLPSTPVGLAGAILGGPAQVLGETIPVGVGYLLLSLTAASCVYYIIPGERERGRERKKR
jgi:hypothetical protein